MSQTSSSSSLEQTKRLVFALDLAVGRLVNVAGEIGIREPRGDVWFTLLKQKLLPQISEPSLMVVAVVGGTNTGKSLLFNQLASENASSVDARAAGTKHPVCILPLPQKSGDDSREQQPSEDLIRRYFKDFTPVQWSGAEQPLESSDTNLLFWRVGSNVPERLMLLDTPDIDSDAEVNWERASAIRQAADILLAVVTPQKYNDAAVRRFFRDATAAGKQTILMWNMVDIEQDASDLPQWTEQFSRETGTQPHAVYVAPHDREAAAVLRLPIHEMNKLNDGSPSINLATMLGNVHFETVKYNALVGAMKGVLDSGTGLPSYLETIRLQSRQFANVLQTLQNLQQTSVEWPELPTQIIVEEVRQWWRIGRPGWSQTIHSSYRLVGDTIIAPVKWGWAKIAKSPTIDPLEGFQQKERDAVSVILENTIKQLEQLAENNAVLRRELQPLLTGENRQKLFERARQVPLSNEPVDAEFREYLRKSLDELSHNYPTAMTVLRSADQVAAVARPLVTATLLVTGFWGASQLINQAGLQASEVIITSGVTAGGEALAHTAGLGIGESTALFFNEVRKEFIRHRASMFFDWLHHELWDTITQHLNAGIEIVRGDEFNEVERIVSELSKKK